MDIAKLSWGAAALVAVLFAAPAHSRDDGRYAASPLKSWFDSLRSKKAMCCSEAEGPPTEYEIRGDTYGVPVDGIWQPVPEDALLIEPNRFGKALLWLTPDRQIRCFLPDAGV